MASEMPDAQQNLQSLESETSSNNAPKPSRVKDSKCKRPLSPDSEPSSRPFRKKQKSQKTQLQQPSEELSYKTMTSEVPDGQQGMQNFGSELSPDNTPNSSPVKDSECKKPHPDFECASDSEPSASHSGSEASYSSRPGSKKQKSEKAQVHQISEEVPYKNYLGSMNLKQFRNAEIRGFVIRSFDPKIFESIEKLSLDSLFHQSKTNTPIVICEKLEDLSKLIVLEGNHRVCSLLSRPEDEKEENFEFNAVTYVAGNDFLSIWDKCVKVNKDQKDRANLSSMPPMMLNLVQTTYGKEFAKSLTTFSMSQQAKELQVILEKNIKKEKKDEITEDLEEHEVSSVLKTYQDCFDIGLVSSKPTDNHAEKSLFFSFFMGSGTKKIFTDNLDDVYKSNKCHFLILKASHVGDDETKDAIKHYLDNKKDKQINGTWLTGQLKQIIKGRKREGLKKEGSEKDSKKKTARGTTNDDFNIAKIDSLDSVPVSSIVMFQEKISEDHVKILKEKNCTVIILKPSTANGEPLLLLSDFPGELRYALFNRSVVIGKGPQIQAGEQVTCTNKKMLIQKLMTPENTVKRKLDMKIYQYIPE